jgi:hypothetical protein
MAGWACQPCLEGLDVNARRLLRASLVLIPLMFLLGCLPPPQVVTNTPGATPTLSPSIEPTATPALAATPQPTRTPRPTQTPPPTRTPVPSPTPLPFPTLEPDAMHAFVVDMLATNGGCELPCWWGIIPGETHWDDMVSFFGERNIHVEENGWLDLRYQSGWHGERPVYDSMMDVTFQREGDLVQGVTVRNSSDYAPLHSEFVTVWHRYTLQAMLSRHGAPSQVHLNLTVGAPCAGAGTFPDYKMWIVYGDQGIAVRYSGLALTDNEKWLVCPVFGQLKTIAIRLQAADAGAELVDPESEVFDLGGDFSVYGLLPDLTGMSVQSFRDTFSQPEPHTCITVSDPTPWYNGIAIPPNPQALSPDAEDALLVDRLANNGGCELPCWWGITPGVTLWEDAQKQFLDYGESVTSWSWDADEWGMGHKTGLLGRRESYPFDYVVEHVFYERDGIVSLIGAQGHVPGWPAHEWSLSPRFAEDWDRYTLDRVLDRFGKPSQVLLHYWGDFEAPFGVAVLYEDRGVLVEYMGLARGEEKEDGYGFDSVVLCPTKDRITDINVWLKSPEAETSLSDVFVSFGGGHLGLLPYRSTPSLEEATGMSLDTFYTTYVDSGADACLEARGGASDFLP